MPLFIVEIVRSSSTSPSHKHFGIINTMNRKVISYIGVAVALGLIFYAWKTDQFFLVWIAIAISILARLPQDLQK